MRPQKTFLPILFALSMMMVPNASYALSIFIEGSEISGSPGPNSVAQNTTGFLNIPTGTYGTFTISQCPGCLGVPRVRWSDGTNVDTLTLTDLRITYLGTGDNIFNISYSQTFSLIPTGIYPNVASGAGTWASMGDTINVSGISNGELIGTIPPSLTQSSSSSLSFNAITFRKTENILCLGCNHVLNTVATMTFTTATNNTLDLPGSLDQEAGNEPIPEPASLLLLGSGLAGFALSRRKCLFKKGASAT